MAVLIPAIFAVNLLQGVTRRGGDPAAILRHAGLDTAARPISHPNFVKLVRTVTLTLDDELGGLQERPQRIGSTAILAAHASHAETLGDAYRRTVQFMDIIDNSFRYTFREEGESAIFEMVRIPGRVVLNELAVEMIMVLVNRMLSWLAGNKGAVNRAWFDYPSPPHAPIYRAMFMQAPVRFEQSSSGLAIPRNLMKLPLVRTEEQAMAYARRTPLDAFLPVDGTTGLALEAALTIDAILTREGRLADMDEVGRNLNMPSHRLRRSLKLEGVDYSDLRKQVRRDLAVRLLTTTDLSIEDIAARAGFSEASSFIRAFRGWTGLTPRAYRVSDL
ncbi:AraC family transcriptional regulator [Roseibium sp. RKSG952]|uniref:AraC family transcriptional regulator n=1 Tax=Roseibium sp. RKSG952 TaxID=2529384 RepID=UPI0012BD4866|nr:AraC family transcriptional regulator [Roseibium sp. RKSG952]MTI01929.1 AraC family transcriptional regulator [Roseibium sp. RKSG952]